MTKIEIRFGLDAMVPEAKDYFIAPKISQFTAPKIMTLPTKQRHLLALYIMNTDLTLQLPNFLRQCCFNFVRKSEYALAEYCSEADALQQHIEAMNTSVQWYFAALRHFEHCLAHLYEGVRYLNQIHKSINPDAYEPQFTSGDASVLDRVTTLHNHIKHMDGKFGDVSIRDEGSFKLFAVRSDGSKNVSYKPTDVANVGVWLVNDGLECREASVTYSELGQELLAFSDEAERIATLEFSNASVGHETSQ